MDRLIKKGYVRSFSSAEISCSRVGIGFEKLDRNAFDPENAYDKVAALGVKWVRIQSGWERTEKEKGVYSFEWLDDIVDNLLRRGLQPWMCLCYGNPLYTPAAADVFGSVGCAPIATEEERQAWHDYVTACVRHYAGRINFFEVWNEPDNRCCWKHGVSGVEYGEFFIRTAEAVKAAAPDAKVIGGVQCNRNLAWAADVASTGAGKSMDYYCYHSYSADEFSRTELLPAVMALFRKQNPDIRLIQGETGCHSRRGGMGALRGGNWTELRQAKFMLRHFMVDFSFDVEFASWFSALDMMEALSGKRGDPGSYKDYGYFGVLRAEFDENGRGTGNYSPKPAYRTLQVLSSLFREEFSVEDLAVMVDLEGAVSPLIIGREPGKGEVAFVGFRKPDGAAAFAYWKSVDLMTSSYEGCVSLISAESCQDIHLVDPMDGTIYEIPEEMMERGNNVIKFKNLPLKDYPLLLTFGKFAEMAE